MKHRTGIAASLVVLMVVLLALVACGGTTDATTSTAVTGGTTASTAAGSSTTAAQGSSTTAASTSTETYKIGLLESLTGPAAAAGKDIQAGAQFEVDRINAAGGINGHQLELVVADDGSDMTKAMAGATKLIEQDKVLAIIGPVVEFLVQPLFEKAEAAGVAVISTTPPGPQTMNKYKFGFANTYDYKMISNALLGLVKDQGYKKIVVIGDSVPAFQGAATDLTEQAKAAGIEASMMSDTFSIGDMDLSAVVTKVKAEVDKIGADAVIAVTNGISAVPFKAAMAQLGMQQPLVGGTAFGMPAMLFLGKDLMNGTLFVGPKVFDLASVPDSDPDKIALNEWVTAFQAKTKGPASQMAGNGTDGVAIIANALKTAGGDRAKLRDAIEQTSGLVGISGTYTYSATDHTGLPVGSLGIITVENVQFKLLKMLQ